ncbi:MAG: mannitol dehydrogenase [Bacilli bacterium]
MKALILGAGRIGRGFITELLTANNVEIAFFDVSQEMVNLLNKHGEYTIHVLGNESKNTEVKNVKAYMINDINVLAEHWLSADYIFTACGGKNLKNVGKILANAYRIIYAMGENHHSNIVTCENWIDPADDLKKAIIENLDENEKTIFLKNTGVSESVILCTGTGAPDPSKVTNQMDTWVQDLRLLPIDRDRIIGELPNLKYIEFVTEFGNLLKQKIYTNNTSVATVAYLGKLKGLTYVADSANDCEIEPILDGVYEEINRALVEGMGIDKESQLTFSKNAKAKYTDRAIIDLVDRIARDPIRKLGPEDRFIGPMKIALKANVKPKSIALGCAAAIYYDNPEDEASMELKKMRNEQGVDFILENISKLEPNDPVTIYIKDAIVELKNKGWIKE